MKHFLTLMDLSATTGKALLARAIVLKRLQAEGTPHRILAGKTLGMIFDKSSTRTRVSFEVGMFQLGGHALFLHSNVTQLGRGESIADSARVLSRMVDGITIRTFEHAIVEEFARYSQVPVINALTNLTHPCQILADLMTFWEHRGVIAGRTFCWIGDGNNMLHSWINACRTFDFSLHYACPAGYEPDAALLAAATAQGANIVAFDDPMQAVVGADMVTTDVWASMGQEDEQAQRKKNFAHYQVTTAMMSEANPNAIFMHCLPAHRGEEVAAEVIDGSQSVVWDEAENRLHVQKALLEWLLHVDG
ncbi:MAG: ornithine carbamoyltransferase [Mariprofundaceae bacterium]|nr:ornithine carbamoyltransferase [Mariprofundaceae bacterium]